MLPFRLLRLDPEIEFLAFGLADAVATTLSSLDSMIVRSSMTAARFTASALDLEALATQAEVDVVLTGTLLGAAGRLRVNAQLGVGARRNDPVVGPDRRLRLTI